MSQTGCTQEHGLAALPESTENAALSERNGKVGVTTAGLGLEAEVPAKLKADAKLHCSESPKLGKTGQCSHNMAGASMAQLALLYHLIPTSSNRELGQQAHTHGHKNGDKNRLSSSLAGHVASAWTLVPDCFVRRLSQKNNAHSQEPACDNE